MRCLQHDEEMILAFWNRPGGPPGNGWACKSCLKDSQDVMQEIMTRQQFADECDNFHNENKVLCSTCGRRPDRSKIKELAKFATPRKPEQSFEEWLVMSACNVALAEAVFNIYLENN